MSNMYLVGSTYWNQIHGTNSEEVLKDLEGMQTMRELAKNMAYILKCINCGKCNAINTHIEKDNKYDV